MVKESRQIHAAVPASLDERRHHSLHAGQIVQAGRGDKFLRHSEKISRIRIVKPKLIIQDIFLFHPKLPGQIFQKIFTFFSFLFRFLQTQHRKKVLLPVQLHALVHVFIDMNSQIGNRQEGLPEIHVPNFRVEDVLTAERHAAGRRKRAVQPGIQNRAAVDFHVDLSVSVLIHLRARLNPKSRKICVSRRNPEIISVRKISAYGKGCQCGAIMYQVIFSSIFQVPVPIHAEFLKAGLRKLPLHIRRHMKRRGSLFYQRKQFFRMIHSFHPVVTSSFFISI